MPDLHLSPAVLFKRLLFYCLGLFIMALGVSFSVVSDLGVSPVNSLPYVLSEVFQTDMGIWTIGVFAFYILLQAAILRRRFHPARLLQLICTFLFGWFVDLTNLLAGAALPQPGSYPVRLVYLVISMALVALGIFFYLAPQLVSLPGEGIMQTISDQWHIPFHLVKIGFDCTVSILALVISLICFHTFHGVREGTVLAAIGVGKFLGFYTKHFRSALNRMIAQPEDHSETVPIDAKGVPEHV